MAEYGNHNFNEGDKGGCLKLLQFTNKANVILLPPLIHPPLIQIPPSFFIGTNSYSVVPAYDKKTADRDEELMKLTLSLVESMLEQDTVAICRYAYHASAHLQLMALIPRKNEETGQVVSRFWTEIRYFIVYDGDSTALYGRLETVLSSRRLPPGSGSFGRKTKRH